jgi:hypothetical protein
MIKRFSLPGFVFIFILFILTGNAFAVGNSDGLIGANNGSLVTGSGGVGGKFFYAELTRLNKGPDAANLPLSLKNQLNSIRNKYLMVANQGESFNGYPKDKVEEEATAALLKECPGTESNSKNRWKTWKNWNTVCPYWGFDPEYKNNFGADEIYYKIHPLKRNLLRGSLRARTEKVISAFSVRVWRENINSRGKAKNFSLIFQRSLAPPGDKARDIIKKGTNERVESSQLKTTSPFWPGVSPWYNEYANEGWFNGYNGRYYKRSGYLGGAISYPNPPKSSGCQENFFEKDVNGNRNFKGDVIQKKGSQRAMRPETINPTKKKKLKRGGSWCYWEGADLGKNYYRGQFGSGPGGLAAKGLKESLFISWSFKDYKIKRTRPYFNYQLEGVPNRFYIVQVVATDSRQRIMSQSAKVFFANGIRGVVTNDCSVKPWECNFSSNPVQVSTRIESESPLQVRQTSSQKAVIETQLPLEKFQSAFPHEVTLNHYTPQLNYNSPVSNSSIIKATYPSEYVSYETRSDILKTSGFGEEAAAAYQPTDNILKDRPGGSLDQKFTVSNPIQKAEVRSAPSFAVGDGITGTNQVLAENNYQLTWMKPTLENPCLFEGSVAANFPGSYNSYFSWPKDLTKCEFDGSGYNSDSGVPVVNVWDDVLTVGSLTETQHVQDSVPGKKSFEYGKVPPHSLRCWNNIFSDNNPSNDFLNNGRYLRNCSSASDSTPYIPWVSGAEPVQKAQGAVVLASKNSLASLQVKIDMKSNYSDPYSLIKSAKVYSREDPSIKIDVLNPSDGINFCLQGVPAGSKYRTDSDLPGQKYDFKPNGSGDQGCRGFAVEWVWDNKCYAGEQPTADQILAASGSKIYLSQYTASGNYWGAGMNTNNIAYNKMKIGTAPYIGTYPTNKSGFEKCKTSSGLDGYKRSGSWKESQADGFGKAAEAGWGLKNDGSRIDISSATFGTYSETYIVEFEIQEPAGGFLSPSFGDCPNNNPLCWKMTASYDGFPNLKWISSWKATPNWFSSVKDFIDKSSKPTADDFSPRDNMAYIKVFGSRTSR